MISNSYDSILNPADRFNAVMNEIMRVVSDIKCNKEEWLLKSQEISRHNINHATSGNFFENYVQQYDKPIVARLKELIKIV